MCKCAIERAIGPIETFSTAKRIYLCEFQSQTHND